MPPRRTPSASTQQPDQVVRFMRAIDRLTDTLAPEGRPDAPEVSSRELQALRAIGWAERDERRLRMSDLAATMRVPLSTASRVVDRLVRKKLVSRDGGTDGRTVHVRFSPHGMKVGRCLMQWRITTAQDRLCLLAGTKVALKAAALQRLYKSKDDYVAKVERRLTELIAQGWFLEEYAADVRADARGVAWP